MPDKDTKKNQQENTTPAVSATEDIQQQRKEALDKAIGQVTFNPESTNIGSMEKAAIARQNLTDDQKRSLGVENAIHNAYSSPIQETSNRISEWETARNTLKAQDETAQRRGRSMQMIAGISDGLASLANLIGVGQGGTNIDMGTGSLTPLAQKIEAARQERKADIKSIDDRLDQYRNQLLQMQLAKGAAMAQAKERASDAAREQARFDIEMAFRQGRAKVADSQWQQTFDANQGNAAADRDLRKTQITNDYNLRLKQLNQSAEQAGLTGSVPILIGDNEMLDIQKNEINNATIGRIFEQLPKEFKDLAQGKPQYKYEDDGFGNSIKTFAGYAPATLEEKLAAIGAAARTDKTIQDELRKLAGTYKPGQKEQQTTQSMSGNWDDYADAEDVQTTDYSNLSQEAQDYLKNMHEREARKAARQSDPDRKERNRAWINTMSNQK
jgi:hypothetical protein